MICPNCQTEQPDGMKFCSACGTPLAAAAAAVESAAEVKEDITSAAEVITEDMPSASFDPGAPIAMPKQKEIVEEVSEIPSPVPEVAPIENVLPEFPQTTPAETAAAPVQAEPIPAPVSAPVPAPMPAEPVAAPIPAPIALTPETIQAPVSSDRNIVPAAAIEKDTKSEQKVLSTGAAFWLMLLFAIPGLGLIFAIIFSAAGKKCQSRKNFARAVLIWQIIAIIAILSLVIVCYFFWKELFETVLDGDMNEVIDLISEKLPF